MTTTTTAHHHAAASLGTQHRRAGSRGSTGAATSSTSASSWSSSSSRSLLGDEGFLTANNLLNIVRQTATIAIIAVGMTYVIACAEIDLSVGSVAGLSSRRDRDGDLRTAGSSPGILAGLLVGVVVGAINGATRQPARDPVLPGHPRHAGHRRRGRRSGSPTPRRSRS